MRTFHLIALIFGALTTICALVALTGVNRGWLNGGGVDCGTIQCCAGGQCVSMDLVFAGTGCSLNSAGKAVEALSVIAFVVRRSPLCAPLMSF